MEEREAPHIGGAHLWRAPVCCALAAALIAVHGCRSAGAPDTVEAAAEPKSVLVGELLAIVPGLVVHGLGHRYAGNANRADELVTMEVYALLTGALGGGLLAWGEDQDSDALRIAGWVGIGVAAVPFLGTWIYDIVYTPSEIEEYNRRRDAGGP